MQQKGHSRFNLIHVDCTRTVQIMWPFSIRSERRKDVYQLTELLLVKRVQAEADLADKKAEAELKTLSRQMEIQAKQLEYHDKKREESRERARAQRLKRSLEGGDPRRFGSNAPRHTGDCSVCRNPSDPHLTANEIIWHKANHADRSESN